MVPLWGKRAPGPTRHVDPESAMARYREELRQADSAGAPMPPAAYNGLGDAFLDQGDIASAVDAYRQAALAYEGEGMYDNAIACCKKIRRHAPEDDHVGLMLGRYYATKGLRFDALRELEAHAARLAREGRRRDVIETLRAIVGIEPGRLEVRERLARALAEEGQKDEAEREYREVMDSYRERDDLEGVQRVRTEAEALRQPAPVAPPRPAPPTESRHVPPPSALEIEPTSYVDHAAEGPGLARPAGSPAPPPPPAQAAAVPPPRAAATAPPDAEGADTARRLYAARRWAEAVHAFRLLSQADRATSEDFTAWAESARQAGDASQVLEALKAAARWNLARGDRPAARRAAEEMLLLDPDSAVATDILERVGTSLPRG